MQPQANPGLSESEADVALRIIQITEYNRSSHTAFGTRRLQPFIQATGAKIAFLHSAQCVLHISLLFKWGEMILKIAVIIIPQRADIIGTGQNTGPAANAFLPINHYQIIIALVRG